MVPKTSRIAGAQQFEPSSSIDSEALGQNGRALDPSKPSARPRE